jgi:Chlorophyll A-B binding protein
MLHSSTKLHIPAEKGGSMESNKKFGFTNFAESWNGRLAMLGFVIVIATEVATGQGILTQLGLM